MLLIHLDNSVTSCSVNNRPNSRRVCMQPHCQALLDACNRTHNGWIFVYNFCTQVWLSVPCSLARCRLICIGRLRRREHNELGLRVGDGGRWWIELSPLCGTFVNVWLVLNGLLLDYRVWGPNLDMALLLGDSPLRVSPDRAVAVCRRRPKREEGVGHVCLFRAVKMFDNPVTPTTLLARTSNFRDSFNFKIKD